LNTVEIMQMNKVWEFLDGWPMKKTILEIVKMTKKVFKHIEFQD